MPALLGKGPCVSDIHAPVKSSQVPSPRPYSSCCIMRPDVEAPAQLVPTVPEPFPSCAAYGKTSTIIPKTRSAVPNYARGCFWGRAASIKLSKASVEKRLWPTPWSLTQLVGPSNNCYVTTPDQEVLWSVLCTLFDRTRLLFAVWWRHDRCTAQSRNPA